MMIHTCSPAHAPQPFVPLTYYLIGSLLLLLPVTLTDASRAMANDQGPHSEHQVAQRAKAAWEQGTTDLAIGILDQGIHENPQAFALHQLRGDMLATSRHTEAALESYETVLASIPRALDVRWAKWSGRHIPVPCNSARHPAACS